jgi:hypothetical protein
MILVVIDDHNGPMIISYYESEIQAAAFGFEPSGPGVTGPPPVTTRRLRVVELAPRRRVTGTVTAAGGGGRRLAARRMIIG